MVDVSVANSALPEPIALNYGGENVSDFLSRIWRLFAGSVEAFTYGSRWYLKPRGGGVLSRELGSAYARRSFGGSYNYDSRSLREVGITPGMHLDVVLIHDSKSKPASDDVDTP